MDLIELSNGVRVVEIEADERDLDVAAEARRRWGVEVSIEDEVEVEGAAGRLRYPVGSWWLPVAEVAETAGLEVRAQWSADDPSQIERVRVVGGTDAEAERAAHRAIRAYGATTYTLDLASDLDGERVYTVVSAPPWAEASS